MAGLKDIRRRIQSVKNTRKITYAMKLVSATKLKKTQEVVGKSKEYTKALKKLVAEVKLQTTELSNPLLEERAVQKVLYIVVGASRGLCGGYNTNLNKMLDTNLKNHPNADVVILGKKPAEYLRRTKRAVKKSFEDLSDEVSSWPIQTVLNAAIDDFLEKTYDEVYLVYTQFRSALSMSPVTEKLLPMGADTTSETSSDANSNVKFEPNPKAVFDALLPRLLRAQVQQAALDSKTGEHGARMTAMDAATKNAGDITKSLTLQYNKVRQAGITAELLDILGGAEASA